MLNLTQHFTGETESFSGGARVCDIPDIIPTSLQVPETPLPLFCLRLCHLEPGLLHGTVVCSLCEAITELFSIILGGNRGVEHGDTLLIPVSPKSLQHRGKIRPLLFTLQLSCLEIAHPGPILLNLPFKCVYGVSLTKDFFPDHAAFKLLFCMAVFFSQISILHLKPLDVSLYPAEFLKCIGWKWLDIGDFLKSAT